MAGLLGRRHEAVEPVEAPETVDLLDRRFADWMSMWPFRRWMPEELIKVDEFRENGTLVVRAELPGIDPDKDVELTVSGGVLHIAAERREQERTEDKGYLRRELRYGSFTRSLPLPDGVTESDVTASYRDGILEIRVPMPPARAGQEDPGPQGLTPIDGTRIDRGLGIGTLGECCEEIVPPHRCCAPPQPGGWCSAGSAAGAAHAAPGGGLGSDDDSSDRPARAQPGALSNAVAS